jgi:hypothetical protein
MANGERTVEQVLGDLCLLADTIPVHDTAKIDYGGFTARDFLRDPGSVERPPAPAKPSSAAAAEGGAPGADAPNAAAAAAGRPPLQKPVAAGSEEAFYLLATYCFDLQRKMEYIYRVAQAYGRRGDPALAVDLLRDERAINAPGLTWKQRALRAEARMLQLQDQVGSRHMQLLEELARRGQRPGEQSGGGQSGGGPQAGA